MSNDTTPEYEEGYGVPIQTNDYIRQCNSAVFNYTMPERRVSKKAIVWICRTSDGRRFEDMFDAVEHAKENNLSVYLRGHVQRVYPIGPSYTETPKWRGKRS